MQQCGLEVCRSLHHEQCPAYLVRRRHSTRQFEKRPFRGGIPDGPVPGTKRDVLYPELYEVLEPMKTQGGLMSHMNVIPKPRERERDILPLQWRSELAIDPVCYRLEFTGTKIVVHGGPVESVALLALRQTVAMATVGPIRESVGRSGARLWITGYLPENPPSRPNASVS